MVLTVLLGIAFFSLLRPATAQAGCYLYFNTHTSLLGSCPTGVASDWGTIAPLQSAYSGGLTTSSKDTRMQNKTTATRKKLYKYNGTVYENSIIGETLQIVLIGNFGGGYVSRCQNLLSAGNINVQCWFSSGLPGG